MKRFCHAFSSCLKLHLFFFLAFSPLYSEANFFSYVKWDGESFFNLEEEKTERLKVKKSKFTISGKSVFFNPNIVSCYGHAILDGVFPLYLHLKNAELLTTEINLLISFDEDKYNSEVCKKTLLFIKDIFKIKNIILLKKGMIIEKLLSIEGLPLDGNSSQFLGFYNSYKDSYQYILKLRSIGLKDNVIFKNENFENSPVRDFALFVKKAYNITTQIIPKKALIIKRKVLRKILNPEDLITSLKESLYDPCEINFENLSIKELIEAVSSAEIMIGTYGSNLTNAIFMHPESSIIILWHKYAKYFWSRRYCIIHSAFLSAGIKLIELDQPDYDYRNKYDCLSYVNMLTDYFSRCGDLIILNPEKINMNDFINIPGIGSYELLNVDLYIEPNLFTEILNSIQKRQM